MEESTDLFESTARSGLDFERKLIFSFHHLFANDSSLNLKKFLKHSYWLKIATNAGRSILECKNRWYLLIQKFLCFSRLEAKYGYDRLCKQWFHYKLLKKMQPRLIQRYTQLFEDCHKPKPKFCVQRSEMIKQIELRKNELMKRTTSCIRRQELWIDIVNCLNQKFPKENMCIVEWQAVWWQLKQELWQLLNMEAIGTARLEDHRRVLKIYGVNSITDDDAIKKLETNYEFDENVADLVICKNCSSEVYELKDDMCTKCLQTHSTVCDICSIACATFSLSTTTWNIRAKYLLPRLCREKAQLSLCSFCYSRLKERASVVWKACRVCAKENEELENLMSSSYTDVRQILQTALGCTIRLSDGLPCFVCIKCRDDLLDFVRFYLTFSSAQEKLKMIHETTLIGQGIKCIQRYLAIKRSKSLPQRSSKRLRLKTAKNNSLVPMGNNIKGETDEYYEMIVENHENILDQESESKLEQNIKIHLQAYDSSEEEEFNAHSKCSLISTEVSEGSDQDESTRHKSSAFKTTDLTVRKSLERKCRKREKASDSEMCTSQPEQESRGKKFKKRNNSEKTDLETCKNQPETASKTEENHSASKNGENSNCAWIEENHSEPVPIPKRRKTLKTQMKTFISDWIVEDVENMDCLRPEDTPSTSARATVKHCNLKEMKNDICQEDCLISDDMPSMSTLTTSKHCNSNKMSHSKRLEGISGTVSDQQEHSGSESTTDEDSEYFLISMRESEESDEDSAFETTDLSERKSRGRKWKKRNHSLNPEQTDGETCKSQSKAALKGNSEYSVISIRESDEDKGATLQSSAFGATDLTEGKSRGRKWKKRNHSLNPDQTDAETCKSQPEAALKENSEYSVISIRESDEDKGAMLKSSALETVDLTERKSNGRKCKKRNISLNLEKTDAKTCKSQPEAALKENSEYSIISTRESEELDQIKGTTLKSDFPERKCPERECKKRHHSLNFEQTDIETCKSQPETTLKENLEYFVTPMRESEESDQDKGTPLKSSAFEATDLTERKSPARECKKRKNSLNLEQSNAETCKSHPETTSTENLNCSLIENINLEQVRNTIKTYALRHRRKTLNAHFKPLNREWIVNDVENINCLRPENIPSTLALAKGKLCNLNEIKIDICQRGIFNNVSHPEELKDSKTTDVSVLNTSVPYSNDTVSASTSTRIDNNSLSTSKMKEMQQTSPLSLENNSTTHTITSSSISNQRITESTSATCDSQEKPTPNAGFRERTKSNLKTMLTPSITFIKVQPHKFSIKKPSTTQPNKQQIVDLKVSNSLKNNDKQEVSKTTNKLLKDILKRPQLEVTTSTIALPLSVRTATTIVPEKIDDLDSRIIISNTSSTAVSSVQPDVSSAKPSTSKSEMNRHEALPQKKCSVLKTPTKPSHPIDSSENTIEIFESDDDSQNTVNAQSNHQQSPKEMDIILLRDYSPTSELNTQLFREPLESISDMPLRTDIALHKTLLSDDDDDDSVLDEMGISRGQITNMGQLHQSSLIDRVVERSFRIEPTLLQIKDVYSMNANVNSTDKEKLSDLWRTNK